MSEELYSYDVFLSHSTKPGQPHRRALFYLVTHPTIWEQVQLLRRRVSELDMGGFDTTRLIGPAALFPDHVTIRGIFSSETEEYLPQMCEDIFQALKPLKPFVVTTGVLQGFSGGTLSIGFSEEGCSKFLELQRAVLPVIQRHRRRVIEPEFRGYLCSQEKLEVEHTREFGEPYVLELYKPHISLVSGLRDQRDYDKVLELAQASGFTGIALTVSQLWLMEEEQIAGNWKAVCAFEL